MDGPFGVTGDVMVNGKDGEEHGIPVERPIRKRLDNNDNGCKFLHEHLL